MATSSTLDCWRNFLHVTPAGLTDGLYRSPYQPITPSHLLEQDTHETAASTHSFGPNDNPNTSLSAESFDCDH